jgi:glutathione S-transferase
MKIYGDRNSGNCLKVKWVCDHLALPYAWIDIDIMKGESRTPEFLAFNPWGQVPTVVLDDGRALAQSAAIIRYLGRDSDLIPQDAFAAAKMDEWLFWEQYSHEPYVAVCRYHLVYLGKDVSELDPEKVRRGYLALDQMERRLRVARFLVETFSLADIALLAYTRLAHEGGFDLGRFPSVQRWITAAEAHLGLPPAH